MPATLEKTMSRLSIEAGHFYAADFREPGNLTRLFKVVRHHMASAVKSHALAYDSGSVSASFMFDDYHNRPREKGAQPREIMARILGEAATAGVRIDYLAREAACTKVASTILETIINSDVSKPYVQGSTSLEHPSGIWLLNQIISNPPAAPAMKPLEAPRPPTDGLFVCAEVYNSSRKKPFACALLAAAWQALRLGIVTDPDFAQPQLIDVNNLPDWQNWDSMPALIQVNPDASPFTADHALSILPTRFLQTEVVVAQILQLYGAATSQETDPSSRLAYSYPVFLK